MSEENVEVVRRVFDVINRGDVDRALEAAADDVEMDWSSSVGPEQGVYRGKEQIRQLWTSFVEAFDELRWDPEEIIEVDDSRVIAVNHVRMRGRSSGADVDATGVQLWTFKDGVPKRVKLYQSRAAALEAAGLSE